MASNDRFEFCEDESPLRIAFVTMYREGELTDVAIRVAGRVFHGHRFLLAAVFMFFKTLFTNSLWSNRNEEIILRNIDLEAFEVLFNFAYTAKISVDSEKVKELVLVADYLQHSNVRNAGLEFLSERFSPENVLNLRIIGNRMNCYRFVNKADAFIRENFELLRKTQEFLNVPFELLQEILNRGDIKVKKPENLYKAASRWLKADPERTIRFRELVNCVQTPLPLPCKSCIKESRRNNIYISGALLDTVNCGEDAFGIYTVSAFGPYNRIVHNYNPHTSSWLLLAKHKQPRSFMTVVSACGLIFAFTGDDLEVFQRDSWRPCGVLPMQIKSSCGNAVSLGSKIYWFPNIKDKDCAVWSFDVKDRRWEEEARSVKLISPGVVSLGRYIYLLGGFNSTEVSSSAMKYDPHCKDFKYIKPMLRERLSPRCAALNDKIYVFGGYGCRSSFLITAEVYDPLNDQWQFISKMRKRWTNFSVVPCEGKLFLIAREYDEYDTVEIYDPDENAWKSGPDFPDRWNSLKAVALSL